MQIILLRNIYVKSMQRSGTEAIRIQIMHSNQKREKTNIPDKIRNATHRTDQLSGRSQVMDQFRLYRCKGISGTDALGIVSNQASKMYTNQVEVKL